MHPTGTHINYFHLCQRKLWLFANGLNMEHTSELVAEGKLIHESSYPQRAKRYREVELDGIKIDYYDSKDKIVHEIKKSDKAEEAHTWQVKYYLYVLKQHGIEGASGILEYPRLRQTETVELNENDIHYLEKIIPEVREIINAEKCPPRLKKSRCRNCSYFDFCWAGEVVDH